MSTLSRRTLLGAAAIGSLGLVGGRFLSSTTAPAAPSGIITIGCVLTPVDS